MAAFDKVPSIALVALAWEAGRSAIMPHRLLWGLAILYEDHWPP